MSVYLTGRTATATYVIPLSWGYQQVQREQPLADGDPLDPQKHPLWTITAPWGGSATIDYWQQDVQPLPKLLNYEEVEGGATVTMSSGWGTPLVSKQQYFGPDAVGWLQPAHPSAPGHVTWTKSFSATITFVCTIEEYISFGYGNGAPDSFGYPYYGGPGVPGDMPQEATLGIFWRPKVGTTATVTVSGFGSQSGVVTAGGSMGDYSASVNVSEATSNASDTISGSVTINGSSPVSDVYSVTQNNSASTMTATTGGGSFSLHASAGTYEAISGTLQFNASPPRSFSLTGVLKAMHTAYPNAMTVTARRKTTTVDLTAAGGAFADGYTQRTFSVNATLIGYVQTGLNVDERTQIQQWIKGTSLTGQQEDIRLWRILMHSYLWDAMTISQAPAVYPDLAPNSAHWTPGAHTAVSGSNPATITVSSGGSGSVSSTLPDADAALLGGSFSGVSFAGYRYLRLFLSTTTLNTTAKVTLSTPGGSKFWLVTVPTSGYVEIDLCAPNGGSALGVASDSKWKFSSVGPVIVQDGGQSGVTNVTQFTIEGLAASTIFRLAKIQLLRRQHAAATFLPPMPGWVLKNDPVTVAGTTTTTNVRRFLLGDTDYRQSLEMEDVTWTVISGSATSNTYSPASIATLVSAVNGSGGAYPSDGWAATDLRAAPGSGCPDGSGNYSLLCLLNSSLPAHCLGGAGWYFRLGAWHSAFDLDVSGSATVPAQLMLDTITDWAPDIFGGDVFGLSASPSASGPLIVTAKAILRGTVTGIVLNGDQTPASGITVAMARTTGGATGGSGTTDAIGGIQDTGGAYSTGSPAGKGQQSYTVTGGASPFILTLISRKRHRISPTVLLASGISYDVSLSGRQTVAYEAGTLHIGFAPTLLPVVFSNRDTGIAGHHACVRFEKWGHLNRVWMAYDVTAGGIYVVTTADEGLTWSSAMTISPTGTRAAMALTRHATKHFFWYSGGAMKGLVLDGANNTIVPVFTAIASGVDDDSITAAEFLGLNGEHRIGLTYRSGGALVFVSARDARTFA